MKQTMLALILFVTTAVSGIAAQYKTIIAGLEQTIQIPAGKVLSIINFTTVAGPFTAVSIDVFIRSEQQSLFIDFTPEHGTDALSRELVVAGPARLLVRYPGRWVITYRMFANP